MNAPRIVLAATLLSAAGLAFFSLGGDHLGGRRAVAQQIFECSDGVDNDGDLLVDFPTDPDCVAPDDNTELASNDLGVDTGIPDLGAPDLATGFTPGEGGSTTTPGVNPGGGAPREPAQEHGCAIVGHASGRELPLLVGLVALALVLRRGVRRRA